MQFGYLHQNEIWRHVEYDVKIMVGDFNVAPDHNMDTLGYLHVNNLNTRRFIDRMKPLNRMTVVFRHKHPDLRQYFQ